MPTDFTQEYLERGTDRIGLQVYPSPSDDGPVAIIWPAMGVKARYYRPFAAALGEQGITVVVADLRGTGASTPPPSRASRYGYPEMIDDVGAVSEALKPRLDGRKRLLIGHSLGGQAAILHLALNDPSDVDGLVLVAVGLPYWRQYPGLRGYGVLPYTQAIGAVTAVAGVWPGWTFGGRQARGVIRDWAYTARTGRFPAIDGVDAEAAVREVRTPVLAVSVDHDQYTPPETLDHICAKLAAAPVRREHYTTAEAGGRLDHFAWVRASVPLASRIATFATTL
jgi:predicted alpha/beta hydrolase